MPSTAARLALAALVTVTTSPLAANALLGTPGSPCEKHCSNQQDHTARDEIVCDRGSIGKTAAGIVWENCINCQLRSNYTSGTMSDQAALLCTSPPSPPFSFSPTCLYGKTDINKS